MAVRFDEALTELLDVDSDVIGFGHNCASEREPPPISRVRRRLLPGEPFETDHDQELSPDVLARAEYEVVRPA